MKKNRKKFALLIAIACSMLVVVVSLILVFINKKDNNIDDPMKLKNVVGLLTPEDEKYIMSIDSKKTFNKIEAGDEFTIDVELYNNGDSDLYVLPQFDISITHTKDQVQTDITNLMSEFISVTNLTTETAVEGSDGLVYELSSSMKKVRE